MKWQDTKSGRHIMCAVTWHDMTRYKRTQHYVCNDMTRYDRTRHYVCNDMTWHGTIRKQGAALCGQWHGMTRYYEVRKDAVSWHVISWQDKTWQDTKSGRHIMCAVTWHDMTWQDMKGRSIMCEMTWQDMIGRDIVWAMTWHDKIWWGTKGCGIMTRHIMTRHEMTRYEIRTPHHVCSDMTCHDKIWQDAGLYVQWHNMTDESCSRSGFIVLGSKKNDLQISKFSTHPATDIRFVHAPQCGQTIQKRQWYVRQCGCMPVGNELSRQTQRLTINYATALGCLRGEAPDGSAACALLFQLQKFAVPVVKQNATSHPRTSPLPSPQP
jgi:hypothetical protein